MDIKAIIFDMDGTLIDSLDVWAESDRVFLNELGYEYDSKVSLAMKKMHFVSACEYLKEIYGINKTIEEIGARIKELVIHSYCNDVPLKEGVFEYISMQHKKGIKMCVATSNELSLAEGALKNLGIYELMEFVITSDEVGCGKESPLIFERAAERMGTRPQNTIVFEDSIHALESAHSAGFLTAGVLDSRYCDESELLKKAADITITSFRELI